SVVTDSNYTKNVIRTASGSFLEFNDGPGLGAVVQKVTGSQLQRQQQYQKGEDGNENAFCTSSGARLNRENTGKSGHRTDGSGMIRATREAGHQGQLEQQQSRESADYDTIEEASTDKWFRVKVPDWKQEKDSYLRLGATPNPKYGEWDEKGAERETDDEEAGWFDYTDGFHTSISGPTMDPAGTGILEENPRRADRPNVDAAMWTQYGVNNPPPPSPYIEYDHGRDTWTPSPVDKERLKNVIGKKDSRYWPYWDENASKRQQYDADNNQWKYSYAVKRDDLIRGSHSEHVQGDRITEIEGTWDCTIKGHLYNTAWGHVHSDYYQSHSESYYGDVLDVYGQPTREVKVTEIAYGPKYEWHFGDKVEVVHTNGGTIYEYHKADKTEYVEGYMEEDHLGGKKTTIRGSETGPEIVEKLFVDDDKKVEVDYGGWLAGDMMHTIESFHGSKEERYYGAHTSMDLGLNVGFFLGLLKMDVIAGILLNAYGGLVLDLYGAVHFESGLVSIQQEGVQLEKGDVSLKWISGVNIVT
ncbi:MAG: hypothetical protein ACFFBV_15625, partial [Promethearchaeota archaeon]